MREIRTFDQTFWTMRPTLTSKRDQLRAFALGTLKGQKVYRHDRTRAVDHVAVQIGGNRQWAERMVELSAPWFSDDGIPSDAGLREAMQYKLEAGRVVQCDGRADRRLGSPPADQRRSCAERLDAVSREGERMLTKEENDLLTQTGPGTPGGDLLRRYWQPVALAEELPPGGAPLPVRLLGEDLVLFRDEQGRPGLLGLHCSHRGADLSYGRLEDGGLRCLYHGWLFDARRPLPRAAGRARRQHLQRPRPPPRLSLPGGGRR